MVVDVDVLSRGYDTLIADYLTHTQRHSVYDRRENPHAYTGYSFHDSKLPHCKQQSKLFRSAKPFTRVSLSLS